MRNVLLQNFPQNTSNNSHHAEWKICRSEGTGDSGDTKGTECRIYTEGISILSEAGQCGIGIGL